MNLIAWLPSTKNFIGTDKAGARWYVSEHGLVPASAEWALASAVAKYGYTPLTQPVVVSDKPTKQEIDKAAATCEALYPQG